MTRVSTIAALAAVTALSACSTVGAVGDAVWPFGDDPETRTAPQDGRISILTFDQALEPDPGLAGRIIAPPAPLPLQDWSQPGGVVSNAPGAILGDATLDVVFRRNIGEGSNNSVALSAPPVTLGGRLFFLDADHVLRAVDATTGEESWRVRIRPERSRDNRATGGGIAAADGKVFVTSGFGMTVALDAASGQEVWRTRADAPFHAAPTVSGGRVYAVTGNSELVCYDANTGAVLWTYQAIAEPARILSASSPALFEDTVVAPFASGELVALLGANGRRLWVDALARTGRLTSLSAINDIAGRPAVDNGVVFAASHSGVLAAIELRTGRRLWARSFASTQTPWVAGQTIFAVTVDSELAALDRNTGAVYWVQQLRRFRDEEDREGRVAWTGPILVGDRLVLASSLGEVVAVSTQSGEILARQDVDDPVFLPPIAAGGLIYVVTDNGRLVALR
jgi:outer membrane protein assembly factor BamB